MIIRNIAFINTFILFLLLQGEISRSQVSAPSSSETTIRSSMNTGSKVYSVNNGKRLGNNLFHVFSVFSVKRKNRVIFNNSKDIKNIFGLVSGRTSSFINGSIASKGSANLFIINPNGIFFGRSASLDIGGSFIASTAGSIEFSSGKELFINDSLGNSLQSNFGTGVPSLLRVNSASGSISINGPGHGLDQAPVVPLENVSIVDTSPKSGLLVSKGNSISLIAKGVFVQGGTLKAPSGEIDILSIREGDISIEKYIASKISQEAIKEGDLFYDNVSLDQLSLLDVSGPTDGKIYIRADDLNIIEGSFLLSQIEQSRGDGEIEIKATGDLLIQGTLNNQNIDDKVVPIRTFSGITTDVINGHGIDISIDAANLTISEGGTILSVANNSSSAGDVRIDVSGDIEIVGESRFEPIFGSSNVTLIGLDSSRSSNLRISAENLYLKQHGEIRSISFSEATGNSIDIFVDNDIRLGDVSQLTALGSNLVAWSFGSGKASDINLSSGNLVILDGSLVGSSVFDSGSGGAINIDVESDILVSGSRIDPFGGPDIPSNIESTSTASVFFQSVFRLPSMPSGDSGDLNISANKIHLSDSGVITSLNEGSGKTGNVNIQSEYLFSNAGVISSSGFGGDGGDIGVNVSRLSLDSGSRINASTVSGDGGNIFIDSVFTSLSRKSQITSSALGSGPGGNINIDSDLITLANSNILANAERGAGGKISIMTQGFFPDRQSNISAVSDSGSDGVVTIEALRNNLQTNLREIPKLQSAKITLSCSISSNSEEASTFTTPGSGGTPSQPSTFLLDTPILEQAPSGNDVVTLSVPVRTDQRTGEVDLFVEAQGFVRHSDGTIGFVIPVDHPRSDQKILVSSRCLEGASQGA